MDCPLCRHRPARRQCPALSREICSVCCGTKRTTEITCPRDCRYLMAAQTHPPATIRRQQERDIGFIMALREGLSETQSDLFWSLLTTVGEFQDEPLVRLTDRDLADATGSLAATLETASRGVIYDHRTESVVAHRLRQRLEAQIAETEQHAGRSVGSRAAEILRHIESGARRAETVAGEGPTTAVDAIRRVVETLARSVEAESPASPIEPPSPLLIRR